MNFFVSGQGQQGQPATTVGTVFTRIWDEAGLPRPTDSQQPRPYDFRHHFAYANMERWMLQGKDVTAMLPYLSRYMGHATFESTFYYIHTSPDFMDAYTQITSREPEAAAGGRVRMRRDPAHRHPELLQLRQGLPAHLHAHGQSDCRPRRSRPTGSAWNAS